MIKIKVGGGIGTREARRGIVGELELSLDSADKNKTIQQLAKRIARLRKIKRGEIRLHSIQFTDFIPVKPEKERRQ